MSARLTHLALAATAGLALSAGPAFASEGPAGPTLPNPMVPPTISPLVPPAGSPLGPGVRVRPRVLRAQLSPRHVRRGGRSRLNVTLATTGRVRVVLERTTHGRHVRVGTVRTVIAGKRSLSVRLRKLRPGRYRVTIVAIDALGNRSAAVHRALRVSR